MKTAILAVSLIAILATGVISPALQDAYALKSDKSSQLSPKAFGEKIKSKIITDDSQKTQKSGFESVKKEQAKSYKKVVAEYKAKQLLKNIYKLG